MEGSDHYKPGVEVGGGRFEIIKKLGEGGMGVVCLAKDSMLDETVAVKFLSPQLGHDEEAMDDMRRETRKSRQLSHRNIVRIHDIYHLPGEAPFITMEYIEGQPLSSLKAEQMDRLFPWAYLEPIVAQMCDALDYAHEEMIVHRDLKPANIMIDEKGRVKLADFGLAATISDSMVKVSKDMGVSGTPSYMGPQQLAGKPSVETDDIYSLGATIYELLCSKPPFYKGDILHQIREEIPLTVEERLGELGLDNEIPSYVSETLAACLDKDPNKRPQSAGEVAELMQCEVGTKSRRSIKGDPNAAVALDSPEASAMLTQLEQSTSAATPRDLPKFVDPPAQTSPVGKPPMDQSGGETEQPGFTVYCVEQTGRRTFDAQGVETIIGRSSASGGADLRLDGDARVSRKHARIFITDGVFHIEDLGSRTGVFVNEQQIVAPSPLADTDIIRVGDTHLSLGEAVFASPPPTPFEAPVESAETSPGDEIPIEDQYVEAESGGKNTKLYAGIGVGAVAVIAGLAFALSGGKEPSQPGPDTAAVAPSPEGSEPGTVSTSLAEFGFVSLTAPDVIAKANVTKRIGKRKDAPVFEASFAKNVLWKIDDKTLIGEIDAGPDSRSKDTHNAGLHYEHLPLNGFEFGIAFSVKRGGGTGPAAFFRAQTPDLAGRPLIVNFNRNEVKFAKIASGGDEFVDFQPVLENDVPDSLKALYETVSREDSASVQNMGHFHYVLRFDGTHLIRRTKDGAGWERCTVSRNMARGFSAGAFHELQMKDGTGLGPSRATIRAYYLRSLQEDSTSSDSSLSLREGEALRDQLMEGVRFLPHESRSTSTVCVYGASALPLLVVETGFGKQKLTTEHKSHKIQVPIGAFSVVGEGKVVLMAARRVFEFSESGELQVENGDNGKLLLNILKWMDPDKSKRIGVRHLNGAEAFLKANGYDAHYHGGSGFYDKALEFGILCVPGSYFAANGARQEILKAVHEGRMSVIVEGDLPTWKKANGNGNQIANEYPGNRFLSKLGMVIGSGSAPTNATGGFIISDPPINMNHAGRAVAALLNGKGFGDAKMAQAIWSVHFANDAVPDRDETIRPRLKRWIEDSH